MQAIDSFFLIAAPDQVIPFRNQISKWATLMTERYAAIHATSCLLLQMLHALWFVNLMPIFDTYINWTALWSLTRRS
jgi:hypothetical protein